MKRVALIFVFLAVAGPSWCQQFQKHHEIILPDSIRTAQSSWCDLDNDGLLDILILTKAQSGKSYLQFVKGDTISPPVLLTKKKFVATDINTVALVDYNHDNKIDVIVSGMKSGIPTTAVYLNEDAFDFDEKILTMPTFSLLKVADLDNDARPEWIIAGEAHGVPYLNILKQETEFNWKVVHDSLRIAASAIDVIDINYDGKADLFISGKTSTNSQMTATLINNDSLYFKSQLTASRSGVTFTGDFNADGIFDVLFMGEESNGAPRTWLYESDGKSFTVKNMPITLKDATSFVADLNSDGVIDINYYGKTLTNDTLNIIQYGVQDYDTLISRHLLSQRFGDLDHDGDLDLLQLFQHNAIHIVTYKNNPSKRNLAPGIPTNAVAIDIFNRVFMYWDKSSDDHTVTPSLTYDLHLNGSSAYQVGDFDLLNERRLLVTHGNNGTENFKLLRNIASGNFDFSVQAIDNAYHAGGLCIGSGNGSPCVNVGNDVLSLCIKEAVTLTSPPGALWFSFSAGFLGIMDKLEVQADKPDTVFYYDPATAGCSGLKAWTIKINNDTSKTEVSAKYVCQDAAVQFAVESGWSQVNWTSQVKGNLGSTNTITYKVTQPDSVFVTLSNAQGCTIRRKTAVKISKPILVVQGENYKISKGGDVQLGVSGAQRYEWTPSAGLSQSNIAAPVASPPITTVYTVTGYDSLNCSAIATITVTVEGAGFIPNLFTPNDDGTNDQLKIYGLSAATDFSFSIYNREGSVVFKTTDLTEALQRGWDGTRSGTKQPPGVYFWKVKGALSSGERILLNGKDAGSIVLVR